MFVNIFGEKQMVLAIITVSQDFHELNHQLLTALWSIVFSVHVVFRFSFVGLMMRLNVRRVSMGGIL